MVIGDLTRPAISCERADTAIAASLSGDGPRGAGAASPVSPATAFGASQGAGADAQRADELLRGQWHQWPRAASQRALPAPS